MLLLTITYLSCIPSIPAPHLLKWFLLSFQWLSALIGWQLLSLIIRQLKMKLYDFKGMFKFKLVMPTIFIVSWMLMLVGQTRVFQDQYQMLCLLIVLKEELRLTLLAIYSVIAWVKSWGPLDQAQRLQDLPPQIQNDLSKDLIHVFVLPNCREPAEVLEATIGQIARHSWAKQKYALILAMQAHEENAAVKAQQMVNKFKHNFLHMGYTVHQLRPHQQKWKASNATWCVQHLPQIYFKPYGIDPEKVLLTVPDADSWVPEIYIHEVEKHYLNPDNYDRRFDFIYCPSQIFMINNHDVPVINRTLDDLHASIHAAHMISAFDITFPLSNYTFSYKLINQIDYWDTCTDAIADDYHTILKAIWKTKGRAKSIPIFTPFNQVNLATGKGYCKDIQAKFWQVERHGTGILDVAYGLNMMTKYEWSFRSILCMLLTFDLYLPIATLPWAMISLAYQGLILVRYQKVTKEIIPFFYVNLFLSYLTFITFLLYFFYFLVKRKASKVLYGLQQSWWRVIEVVIFLPINTFFVNIPSITIAAFSVLFSNKQFTRSDKNIQKKQLDPTKVQAN